MFLLYIYIYNPGHTSEIYVMYVHYVVAKEYTFIFFSQYCSSVSGVYIAHIFSMVWLNCFPFVTSYINFRNTVQNKFTCTEKCISRLYLYISIIHFKKKQDVDWVLQLNSMALVHKQTIPTKRPPLVGEVSANFCG
jgi:hypothetical protein